METGHRGSAWERGTQLHTRIPGTWRKVEGPKHARYIWERRQGGRDGEVPGFEILTGAAEWAGGWGRWQGDMARKPQHVSPVLGLARSKEEEDARLSTCREFQAQSLDLG